MDFFQTIFKTNISLSGIFENYMQKTEFHANQTNLLMVVAEKSEAKNPEIDANIKPALRILIS